MSRFVILAHDWPSPHFDFMLEQEASLRTWRLPEAPWPGCRLPAEEIAPHRLDYLDYEGPVSRGRGTVIRWDYGTYLVTSPPDRPLTISLQGRKIEGIIQVNEESGATHFDLSRLVSGISE